MTETQHAALDDPNAFVLYRYHPTLIGAIIMAVCFIATTVVHIYQMCRRRTWYLVPLVIGGLFEFIGYACRAVSSKDQWALGPYIGQSLLILVAPALMAASIYMILGRIIVLVGGEQLSLLRMWWLTKFFVAGDILSFTLQGSGGGIMAGGTLSSMKLGEHIIVVGLFVQIAFFGFFIVSAVIFHRRLLAHPTPCSSAPDIHWRKHLHALYGTSVVIMVRSIFRVVEYLNGNDGVLLRTEVYIYIFDALLMFIVLVVFNVVRPGEIKEMYQEKSVILLEMAQRDRDSEAGETCSVQRNRAW